MFLDHTFNCRNAHIRIEIDRNILTCHILGVKQYVNMLQKETKNKIQDFFFYDAHTHTHTHNADFLILIN